MADIRKMQGLYDAIGVVQPGVSWVTGDGMAQRVIESAHARAMAEEARAVAAQCHAAQFFRVPVQYDPEAAVRAAEGAQRRAARRLMSDKLAQLAERGRIGQCEWRAALEMRHVVEYVEGGRMPLVRSQLRERLPSGGDGTGELIATEELVRIAYDPWRRYARRYPVTKGATLECLTRGPVFHGKGLRQVANDMRIDQRRVERLLRRSLSHYAGLRGWPSAAGEECC
jgi:hypothetical protein